MNIAYSLFPPIITDQWKCFHAHVVTNSSMKNCLFFYDNELVHKKSLWQVQAPGNWYNMNLLLNFYFFVFRIIYMYKIFTKYNVNPY